VKQVRPVESPEEKCCKAGFNAASIPTEHAGFAGLPGFLFIHHAYLKIAVDDRITQKKTDPIPGITSVFKGVWLQSFIRINLAIQPLNNPIIKFQYLTGCFGKSDGIFIFQRTSVQ
jgi:hypothetical protein